MNLRTLLSLYKEAMLDADDIETYGSLSASITVSGYVVVYTGKTPENKSGLSRLHRLVTNAPTDFEVDHLNRNKLDNRKDNLAIVTRRLNMYNIGAKGYYLCKLSGKYRAMIKINGRSKSLGRFDSEQEAKFAYEEAVKTVRNSLN